MVGAASALVEAKHHGRGRPRLPHFGGKNVCASRTATIANNMRTSNSCPIFPSGTLFFLFENLAQERGAGDGI